MCHISSIKLIKKSVNCSSTLQHPRRPENPPQYQQKTNATLPECNAANVNNLIISFQSGVYYHFEELVSKQKKERKKPLYENIFRGKLQFTLNG